MELKLILTLFISFIQNIELVGADRQLELVQVVFRHGDRSPVHTYPKDPNKNKWTQGLGQLTKIGMHQHYELGQFFRNRYVSSFLSQQYKRNEFHARSTDVDRTLMSAYSNLAGLYPPTDDERFNETLDWQPIPVHTIQKSDDHLLNPDTPCDKADADFDKFMKSENITREEEANKDFYTFVSNKTGVEQENITDIWEISDNIKCVKSHNYTVPDWVNDTVWEKLQDLSSLEFDARYGTKLQGRLRGGPLLREMVHNMDRKINFTMDPPEMKFFMFSGHDSTVTAFLAALNVFNDIMPPYAAAVMVELYSDPVENYTVRFLYRNDTTREPYNLTLPGCEEFCPWSQFMEIVSPILPTDWHKECSTGDDFWQSRNIIAIACGGALGVLVIIVVLAIVVKRRHDRDNFSAYFGIQNDPTL